MTDNRVFDRNGNLFVSIVSYDYDLGWICEEWHDGEYEVVFYGICDYKHSEGCRFAAVRAGLEIARQRHGRMLHHYESPEEIERKKQSYADISR